MAGIEDIIRQQLSGDRISEISQSIGADPATTRQAVEAAVPMLVGGLAGRAANTAAAAPSVDQPTAQQGGMLDDIGGMLGGGGGLGGVLGGMLGGAGGGGILGDLLGSKQPEVEDGVAQASGLDRAKAGKLLMVLAPIVLAAIARQRQGGAGETPVTPDLQREADRKTSEPQLGGVLGSILNKATGQDKRT